MTKEQFKLLYAKDKNLALSAAKVLGYKVEAEDYDEEELEGLKTRAWKNAADKQSILEDTIALFKDSTTLQEAANKVDPSFLRKLFNFPGDITSTRISKVLSKILKL